ncbi:hypothetical protein J4440_02785 [Candidatus Woesearchaeota archaeon]|nr:hypothetical protein [Candidatus Woesearchaeota archaeon]
MEKIIKSLLILFLLVMPFTFSSEIAYPTNSYNQNNQYYTVTFDGEGEASVIGKLNFYNFGKNQINNIRLEIPGNNIRIINIVQEYYGYNAICAHQGYEECFEYSRQRDYTPKYSIINYKKEITSNAVLLDLQLYTKINSQESASIIIYYKSEDYAEKSGNIFNYDFETIKTKFDVNFVQVGINVNNELYLKEGKSKTVYQDNSFTETLAKGALSASDYSTVYRSSGSIGYGSYVKSTSTLDPYESFKVKGKYSESWLSLNLSKVFIISLITLVVLFLLSLISIKLFKIIKKQNKLILVIVTGLIIPFILSILWTFSIFIIGKIGRLYYFRNSEIFILLIILILGLLSLIGLVGPAIYFATKYKPIYSLWYLVSFISFAFICGLIFILLLNLIFYPKIY